MSSVSDPDPSGRPLGVAEFYEDFVSGTLPLFLRHGWDERRDGLVERLAPDLTPDATPFRRSMVHGRQLYVYGLWGDRLKRQDFAENADRIFDQLVRRFRDSDHGGWIDKVDLQGEPLSLDKVLYTHAFVLFGLSAYRYCLAREQAADCLDHTLEYIESRFRRRAGLYKDLLDRSGQAIDNGVDQNPLMHLLEALLFLFQVSGRPEALEIARSIVDTVTKSFLKEGFVVEHLTGDLAPHPENGHIAEPGHQVEWAWLFDWYAKLSGTDSLEPICRTLINNGVRTGWDRAHGGMFDQVDRNTGQAIKTTKRLWPLEELIKAAAVFPDDFRSLGMTVESLVGLLCSRYLKRDGTWSERLNNDLSVADPTMPTSSCYHTSLALTEALAVTGGGGTD